MVWYAGTISFPELTTVGEISTSSVYIDLSNNQQLRLVHMPKLKVIGEMCTSSCFMRIQTNSQLRQIDVGGLHHVGGSQARSSVYVWVTSNTMLDEVNFTSLQAVGQACTSTCQMNFISNRLSKGLDLSNLESVGITTEAAGSSFNLQIDKNTELLDVKLGQLKTVGPGCTSSCMLQVCGPLAPNSFAAAARCCLRSSLLLGHTLNSHVHAAEAWRCGAACLCQRTLLCHDGKHSLFHMLTSSTSSPAPPCPQDTELPPVLTAKHACPACTLYVAHVRWTATPSSKRQICRASRHLVPSVEAPAASESSPTRK